jgi:hypothetical protein
MKRIMTFVVLIATLEATPAVAHEKGGDRAMGVVESVSTERIVIQTADGHPVAFTITKDTRFFRGAEPVRFDDVKAGQRAVVQGKRFGEDLRAVDVKVGASVKPR